MFKISQVQAYVGIGLVVVAVLAFVLTFLSVLPHSADVTVQAHPLPAIPRDLFASDNELNQAISKLTVPANTPVTVHPENLGRANAFENF